jgi:hypothetical protein
MNNKTDLRCWGKLFDFRLHQLIFCTSEMNACIWWKRLDEAPFICWKVVSFWKVNSGESEFRESIFQCLVV